MNFVGLDIGSHTIKGVELKKEGGKKTLFAYNSMSTPPHTVASDSEDDLKSLSISLKKFFKDANFDTYEVNVALPESQVFTRVITVPKMSDAELKNAIKWEAEQYIPLSLSEVSMDFRPLGASKDSSGRERPDRMDVLLIAAPLTVIKKYVKVVKDASLDLMGVESEAVAVSRAVVGFSEDILTTLVINIGAATTDLAIVSSGAIRFTRSISTGGTALARAISQSLGFEMNQAEEYKKSYGLEESKLEGKIMEAIKPIFDVIVSEIKRSIAYYSNHRPNDSIKRVVICGGTASLPGILVYLAAALNIEVQLGNPWQNVNIPQKFSREELEEIGPSFAVAVGLAMK